MTPQEKLDSLYYFETPEGVELSLAPAGIYFRMVAFLVDLVILLILLSLVGLILELLGLLIGGAAQGLEMLGSFLIYWSYPVFCELRFQGATAGKKVMGLKVVMDNGVPVTLSASLLRNFLLFADFLPLFFLTGANLMLFHPQHKRLGDIAAGTVVVHRSNRLRRKKLPASQSIESVVVGVPLTAEERQAVCQFAERSASWNPSRLEELANVAEPLSGATGKRGVQRLQGMAQFLMEEK